MNKPDASTQDPQQGNTCNPRPIATCDQEVWVKERIITAIMMALAIHKNSNCRADEIIRNGAIEGLVNGAACEIIRTLGFEPEFTNLRRPIF